jgi:hypothetical protein
MNVKLSLSPQGKYIKSLSEQGTEERIWTQERWCNRTLFKTWYGDVKSIHMAQDRDQRGELLSGDELWVPKSGKL